MSGTTRRLIILAILSTAPLLLGMICDNDDSLELRCPTVTSTGSASLFVDPFLEEGNAIRVYILQASSDGGAVAFAGGAMSWGTQDDPRNIVCDSDNCDTIEVPIMPVSDGRVTIELWNKEGSAVAIVDTCVLDVRGDSISPAGTGAGFASVAYELTTAATVVRAGLSFDVQLEVVEPILPDAATIRVTGSRRIAGGPWEFDYPTAGETFDIVATVLSDATVGEAGFTVEVLDAAGIDLNNDDDPDNNYSGSGDTVEVVLDDGRNYDITITSPTLHFENLNPYELTVSVEDIPDDATEIQIILEHEGDRNGLNIIRRDELAGGSAVRPVGLRPGVTKIFVEWEYFADVLRLGEHDTREVMTNEGGGPRAAFSWEPLIMVPSEEATMRVDFAIPCDSESRYGLTYLRSRQDEIVVPAETTAGSVSFTPTDAEWATITVVTNGCNLISATHEVIIHPAGDDLFTGFAGSVTGSLGTEATLEVSVAYIATPIEMTTRNEAQVNVTYTETAPENFTVALTAGLGPRFKEHSESFDGPGGAYDWALRLYEDDPATDELEGTFNLTRPDGTTESFSYSLQKK